jgi:hypothetical protein
VVPIKPRPFALVALLLTCFLLPGKVMGAVLCIGADGHIAIEAAHYGACGTPQAHFFSGSDHHAPCTDIGLSSGDADYRTTTSLSSPVLKLEVPPFALSPASLLPTPTPLVTPLVSRRLLPPITLTFLRPVMLLI